MKYSLVLVVGCYILWQENLLSNINFRLFHKKKIEKLVKFMKIFTKLFIKGLRFKS